MAGFWSHPTCFNCQTLLDPNFFQSPCIEENPLFSTANPGLEQLQGGNVFAPPASGILQYADPLYAPETPSAGNQLWSNISERDDHSFEALTVNVYGMAENLPIPAQVKQTAKDFTATISVAQNAASPSPPSKPQCPSCNKGFTRISDLNRHYHQVHRRLRWNCHLACGNNRGNGWSREDKLKEHIRREHPSFNLAKPGTSTKMLC